MPSIHPLCQHASLVSFIQRFSIMLSLEAIEATPRPFWLNAEGMFMTSFCDLVGTNSRSSTL